MNLSLVPVSKTNAEASFDCGYSDLNEYLRRYAVRNDKLSTGKTFIALNDNNELAGYFTVRTAQLAAVFAVLVDEINEKAKAFYVKYGFIPFEEHPQTLFLPPATIENAIR